MQFAHTWEDVLNGQKTMTRRLVKPNQIYDPFDKRVYALTINLLPLPAHMTGRKTTVYQVGKTYAVQTDRGVKGTGYRIRITDIRREDVRNISQEDAWAEGFTKRLAFWMTWAKMHDPTFTFWFDMDAAEYYWHIGKRGPLLSGNWKALETVMSNRPASRYDAWVLSFTLVK